MIAKLITERPTKLRVRARHRARGGRGRRRQGAWRRCRPTGSPPPASSRRRSRRASTARTRRNTPRSISRRAGCCSAAARSRCSRWRCSASGSARRRAAAGATRRRSSSAIARSSPPPGISDCRRSPATGSSSRTSRRAARPPAALTRWSCRMWVSPPRAGCSRARRTSTTSCWSPDRRNLLLGGTVGGRSGLYLVSALGGTPRLLPTGAAGFFAEGDSLLARRPRGAWRLALDPRGGARRHRARQHRVGGRHGGAHLPLGDPQHAVARRRHHAPAEHGVAGDRPAGEGGRPEDDPRHRTHPRGAGRDLAAGGAERTDDRARADPLRRRGGPAVGGRGHCVPRDEHRIRRHRRRAQSW